MYIRTECGLIVQGSKENDGNGIEICNNDYAHDWSNGRTLKIKSQGDNLIDVLEVDDMILDKRLTIFLRLDKFITSTYNDFIQLDIGTGGYIIEENISKVITHEQYMPLAQEVNNVY